MIAYLVHRFPVATQTFTYDEVLHLGQYGCDVTVFSFRPGSQVAWPLQSLSLRVLPHPGSPKFLAAVAFWALRRPLRLVRAAAWCIGGRFVRRPSVRERLSGMLALPRGALLAMIPGVDLYHAQFANEAATTALVASYLSGRPFSFRSHTSPNPQLIHRKLRSAALVLAISDYDRVSLQAFEPTANVQVVRLGVQIPSRVSTDRRRGLIVSVGSLIEKKGHHVLIEALRLLTAQGIRAVLTVVGEGAARRQLEMQISAAGLDGRVTLAGELPHRAALGVVEQAQVCALASLPSRDEGLDGIPVALMEALALGTPCVSTAISGIPELIRHEETGLLVAPADPAKLAAAIRRLLDDSASASRLADAGRRLIQDDYDANANYAHASSLLRAAAARSSGPFRCSL